MSHEHHASHLAPGFGKNTNGLGIFIIAVVFVLLGLFAWNLWNNGEKEYDHYRLEKKEAAGHDGHAEGHSSH